MVAELFLFALLAASQVSAICNADNCLRALRATSVTASASAFCSSYMKPKFAGTVPAYASPCSATPSRISSACSCLTASGTSTTSSPTTSRSSTSSTSTTTSASFCGCTSTSFVTVMPTCASTSTASTTVTSTITATATPTPTELLLYTDFEDREGWYGQNFQYVEDSEDTPAHTGNYAAQLSATGPAADGTGEDDASLSQDFNGLVVEPGDDYPVYIVEGYYYIESLTSTDDTDPSCSVNIFTIDSTGTQTTVYSFYLNYPPGTLYQALRDGDAPIEGPQATFTVSLTCDASSGGGQYSAVVLFDDLFLFGFYNGPPQQR